MTTSVKYAVVATLAAGFAVGAFAKVQTWGDEKYRPRLFKRFDAVLTPVNGNLFHITEVCLMIIDAILHQIVQELIRELKVIADVIDDGHLGDT